MSKPLFAFFLAVMLLSPFSGAAGQQPEQFVTYGLNGDDNAPISCGSFTNDSNNVIKRNYWTNWVAGFVSAMNASKLRWTSTDMNGMMAWLDKYCRANPLEPLASAVFALDRELGPGKPNLPPKSPATRKY